MFWFNVAVGVLVVVAMFAMFGVIVARHYGGQDVKEIEKPRTKFSGFLEGRAESEMKMAELALDAKRAKAKKDALGLRGWRRMGHRYEIHFNDGTVVLAGYFYPSGEFCYHDRYYGAIQRIEKQLSWGKHKALELKGDIEEARRETLALGS